MKLLSLLLILSLVCGCSAKQLRQEFFGWSVNDVRTDKHKQTNDFNMSAADCVDRIKKELFNMGAIITREDKKERYMLVDNFQKAFKSSIDTTQVGILVTPTADGKCRVEIASGNIDLAQFVSNELVKRFGG